MNITVTGSFPSALLAGILATLFVGCTQHIISPPPTPTSATPVQQLIWQVQSDFDSIHGPKSSLALIIDESTYLIRANAAVKFSVIDREKWSEHDIPSNALTAAHGWWAGNGETLYVQKNDSSFSVYWRGLSEGEKVEEFSLIRKF